MKCNILIHICFLLKKYRQQVIEVNESIVIIVTVRKRLPTLLDNHIVEILVQFIGTFS